MFEPFGVGLWVVSDRATQPLSSVIRWDNMLASFAATVRKYLDATHNATAVPACDFLICMFCSLEAGNRDMIAMLYDGLLSNLNRTS